MIDIRERNSEEFKAYVAALCQLASNWVPEIRAQYAKKAAELYQNETVRKIVLAYGEEVKKLNESRLMDFTFAVDNPEAADRFLDDTCLNNAAHYGATIRMLFDIK